MAPALAVAQISALADWRLLAGAPFGISLCTFFAYRSDKRRAERGAWRIPENILHGFEMIGGWPGAYLAQRVFRHKTAKTSFQVIFWAIVMLHQFIAIDSLLHWRLTQEGIRLIERWSA